MYIFVFATVLGFSLMQTALCCVSFFHSGSCVASHATRCTGGGAVTMATVHFVVAHPPVDFAMITKRNKPEPALFLSWRIRFKSSDYGRV